MVSDPKETAAAGAGQQREAAVVGRREQVTSADDGERVITRLRAAMARSAYDELALDRLLQALGRALPAALWRAQRLSPGRPAWVTWQVNQEYVLAEVEGCEALPAESPLQGPHAPQFRQPPAGGERPVPRSYTWLRCHRRDSRLEGCSYWSVP
jgi:hypothetical protein